nr:TetR/AcrR family transcriptional regulator [Rubrobacteraceae bacterium]
MEKKDEFRVGTRRKGGRSARVREAVLAAALDELTEYGFSGMSTARIADRAGVHRTTVHRRWPDHAELITEALFESAGAAVPIPDTGTVRGDLYALLHEISALIDTPERRRRIRGLLADASRSPEIGALVSRVWSTRFELGREVIERGVVRGELRTDIPPATMLATFVGPLYVRLLITDERIDDEFVEHVIDA